MSRQWYCHVLRPHTNPRVYLTLVLHSVEPGNFGCFFFGRIFARHVRGLLHAPEKPKPNQPRTRFYPSSSSDGNLAPMQKVEKEEEKEGVIEARTEGEADRREGDFSILA